MGVEPQRQRIPVPGEHIPRHRPRRGRLHRRPDPGPQARVHQAMGTGGLAPRLLRPAPPAAPAGLSAHRGRDEAEHVQAPPLLSRTVPRLPERQALEEVPQAKGCRLRRSPGGRARPGRGRGGCYYSRGQCPARRRRSVSPRGHPPAPNAASDAPQEDERAQSEDVEAAPTAEGSVHPADGGPSRQEDTPAPNAASDAPREDERAQGEDVEAAPTAEGSVHPAGDDPSRREETPAPDSGPRLD